VHPDREVMLRHAAEHRAEFLPAQWLAGDIGEDLHAARAEVFDRAINLGQRRVNIIHRQRRDEGGEMVGIFRTQIGKRIVCDTR